MVVYYTVNPDSKFSPKSFLVRIFKNDDLVRTVVFPICNPHHHTKAKNQASELGRLAVREIMDKELAK